MAAGETECAIKFRKPKAVADVKSQQFPTGYIKYQPDSRLTLRLTYLLHGVESFLRS